jgi:predicted metal-dependent peptidase
MMVSGRKGRARPDPAKTAFEQGQALLAAMPIFHPILNHITIFRREGNLCPDNCWAVVTSNGQIHVHPTRRGQPVEWQYVLAHCLLHLTFEHFQEQVDETTFKLWNTACDCFIAHFLAELKIGRPPPNIVPAVRLPGQSEEAIFRELLERGVPDELMRCGTTSPTEKDMLWEPQDRYWLDQPPDWPQLFARGVSLAANSAVAQAGKVKLYKAGTTVQLSLAQQARGWFVATYQLLGALAASFEIIEKQDVCQRMQISVAAVDAVLQEIYINPSAGLNMEECRFVIAHEMLHVGLRHEVRRQGRDPFFWNVACDYVINSWLAEMGIGVMPSFGALYDESLKGMSAESVYDRIVTNLRQYRKLYTLRGKGMGDILCDRSSEWWQVGEGITVDEFYRRCLAQGLEYHGSQGRGFLPAGLVEEIRALAQPPIPWDVQLARWFDLHFSPLEKRRSYARPSRRQSATPDIPRPSWTNPSQHDQSRTFGVVLDTSGSMDRHLLAAALGAIASYAVVHDVPLVRVVFCDATYYDQGYMAPEAIADRVKVRGRGGTVLQPAITYLERVQDFPKDGPLLIITDGECDRFVVSPARDHAYLVPKGRCLPFVPKGPVFCVE